MNREFWEARLKAHGHTGWSDPVVYAYDQHLRLAAVTDAIKHHVRHFGQAIDFGCGVGDFSRMLGRHFRRVVASDISGDILEAARERLPGHVVLAMTHDLWARIRRGSADLILSITVLQHIVRDGELATTLTSFHDALSPDGILVVLESFDTPSSQGHLRSWTEEEMLAWFAKAQFRVVERRHFRNPVTTPGPGFLAYTDNIITRILARLSRSTLARRLLHWHAGRRVRHTEAYAPSSTGTNLLVLKRA